MSKSGESDRGNSRQSILTACLPKTSTRHGSEVLRAAVFVTLLLPEGREALWPLAPPTMSATTLLSKSSVASRFSMRVKNPNCGAFAAFESAFDSSVVAP